MGVLLSATPESPLDDLLAAAQAADTEDSPFMAEILNRFEPLVRSTARSLTSNWSLQQDAAQGARIGLVKAARAHKIGTPGFPAYARRYMRGAALRTLMAMNAQETSIDPVDYAWLDKPARDGAEDSVLEFTDLVSTLKPDQRALVSAIYIEDRPLADIALSLGVTKPAISQRLSTVHRTLRPTIEGALAA